MVKIQRLPNGQLVITIPKRLAELKGWDKGTNLVFMENDKTSFIIAVRKDDDNGKDDAGKKEEHA